MVLSERGGVDWEQMYREHSPRLRRLIAHRVPGAAVDDVLQDTFVRAYRSRDRLDTTRPLWPFLATLAQRASIQWHRSHSGVSGDAARPVDGSLSSDFPGSDEHLAGYVEAQRVVEVLARLRPRHRRILFLHGVEDHGCDAIAAADQLSEKAVRSLLDRARANFRAGYQARADRPLVAAGFARHWWLRVRHRVDALRWDGYERLGILAVGTAVSAFAALLAVTPNAPGAMPPSTRGVASRSAPTQPAAVQVEQPRANVTTSSGVRPSPAISGPSMAASARAAVDRPSQVPAFLKLQAGTGWINTDEESTRSLSFELHVPVAGITITGGNTVYCDRAVLATVECAVLGLLPSQS